MSHVGIGISVHQVTHFIEGVYKRVGSGGHCKMVRFHAIHDLKGKDFKLYFSCRDKGPSDLEGQFFPWQKGYLHISGTAHRREGYKCKDCGNNKGE